MDRIDAMKVFVATLDEGSLAAAGRKLGRSPAAVSRAVAFLEGHVGVPLLHRTTRSIKLSEAGERYAAACRRMLTDLDEHERSAFARALYRILRVLGPLPLDYEIHQGEGLPLHAHINARLYPYSNVAGTLNIPSTLLHSAIALRKALS